MQKLLQAEEFALPVAVSNPVPGSNTIGVITIKEEEKAEEFIPVSMADLPVSTHPYIIIGRCVEQMHYEERSRPCCLFSFRLTFNYYFGYVCSLIFNITYSL